MRFKNNFVDGKGGIFKKYNEFDSCKTVLKQSGNSKINHVVALQIAFRVTSCNDTEIRELFNTLYKFFPSCLIPDRIQTGFDPTTIPLPN